MALLNKRLYTKKEAFRDAVIFIVICEGEKREPGYFKFFDSLTSQLKVLVFPSEDGKSAPNHMINNANETLKKLNSDEGAYELWFVLDVDRWKKHIHSLQKECNNRKYWNIAISNPCFEVWLYYHFKNNLPDVSNLSNCSVWKQIVDKCVNGGFDNTNHPTLINSAIKNSKNNYNEAGYIPEVGSTQLHKLGEKIFKLIKKVLSKYDMNM